MAFTLPKEALQPTICGDKLGTLIFEVARNFVIFMGMVIACNGLHFLLKPFSQPRITSDIIVGLVVGNIGFVHGLFEKFNRMFGFIIDFGMMCYMFVLGIEMDPYVLFKRPTRHAKVACAGIFCTFFLATAVTPTLQYFPSEQKVLSFSLCLSTMLSSTDSPIITRLLTQLKIGKSDIGKLVIAAGVHSDMLSYLILSIGYIVVPLPLFCHNLKEKIDLRRSIKMGCVVVLQVVFTALVSPFIMNWVNNENPEGRPMKGQHLVLSIAFMALMCAFSTLYDYSPILSAFLVGICLPREGRVSKWVINKINYMLATIFFPIFFLWMGCGADFSHFGARQIVTWARLFLLLAVVTVGKVGGTLISGAMMGFHWPESIAIGLLLITKGHLHIYFAIKVIGCGASSLSTSIVMVIATFLAVVPAPIVVANIIKRAKRKTPTHRFSLQSIDPSSEIRILLCVHGPQNVPASINLVEITKGPAEASILVYVTDMIELSDETAATLERDEGAHTATVQDKEVMDMRNQVTNSFQPYVEENGDSVTLRRNMVISTINNMPQDISILAEDFMIALIILPFHRSQRKDGTLDGGNPGFRYVNRKVLRSAPCSIGILVDRGLGSIEHISGCEVMVNVAVIFIGGKDDREALAYAGRVARHPGVKLTVIRFLVDSSVESSRLVGYRVILPEQEKEMQLDDECFAQFYEKHVIGGRISYLEKHHANAAETFATLRSFEGQYSLVIVGREGGVNSILTKGMNDWQQCPELGPIGDVLSGTDFSTTVSVLIIQQHILKGDIDGLDEDFSVI